MTIWQHELTGAMFPDAYNPFGLANVPGDWSWLDTKKVDMGPYFRRRGLVFVDGKPLEPMEQSRELGNTPLRSFIPTPPPTTNPQSRGGLPARTRGGPIMQEIGGSPDARFWVEHQGNVIHIRVPADTPAKPLIEITTREQVFVPLQSGLGYIRIKGITFQHAPTASRRRSAAWSPPPAATTGSSKATPSNGPTPWGWTSATATWRPGAATRSGTAHIIRGNTIRYCGVEGIGGMGTQKP